MVVAFVRRLLGHNLFHPLCTLEDKGHIGKKVAHPCRSIEPGQNMGLRNRHRVHKIFHRPWSLEDRVHKRDRRLYPCIEIYVLNLVCLVSIQVFTQIKCSKINLWFSKLNTALHLNKAEKLFRFKVGDAKLIQPRSPRLRFRGSGGNSPSQCWDQQLRHRLYLIFLLLLKSAFGPAFSQLNLHSWENCKIAASIINSISLARHHKPSSVEK